MKKVDAQHDRCKQEVLLIHKIKDHGADCYYQYHDQKNLKVFNVKWLPVCATSFFVNISPKNAATSNTKAGCNLIRNKEAAIIAISQSYTFFFTNDSLLKFCK